MKTEGLNDVSDPIRESSNAREYEAITLQE